MRFKLRTAKVRLRRTARKGRHPQLDRVKLPTCTNWSNCQMKLPCPAVSRYAANVDGDVQRPVGRPLVQVVFMSVY